MLLFSFSISPKVTITESAHRKTQTLIVIKQKTNDMENTIRKLAESTFLPLFTNLRRKKAKGYTPPL